MTFPILRDADTDCNWLDFEGVEKELPRLTLTSFQQSDLFGGQIIEGIDLRLFSQMSSFYV